MARRIRKIVACCMIGTMTLTFASQTAITYAAEIPLAGIPLAGIDVVLDEYYQNNTNQEIDITKYLSSEYDNIAIASVTDYVNIRSKASEDSEILGKLYNDSAATILETDGEWYKVESGTVTGYIKSEYVVTGEKVEELAKEVGQRIATVTTTTLKVRDNSSLDATVKTLLPIGDELNVIKESKEWVKVELSNDDTGYISKDFIDLRTEFNQAESIEEEKARLQAEAEEAAREAQEVQRSESNQASESQYSNQARTVNSSSNNRTVSNSFSSSNDTNERDASSEPSRNESSNNESSNTGNASSKRSNIVNYALRFVGNPYVWGGTSLTHGADCSGFTQSVFRDNGISIPRTSRAQASSGRAVSISNLQPGDLIFYTSGGTINHVAIYIGNGRVVNASNEKYGIRISAYNYRQPYKAVSYID